MVDFVKLFQFFEMSLHTFLTPRLVKMLDCDLKPIEVILVECPFWLASSITQGMVWPDQQFFNQFDKVTEEITAQPIYDITAGKKLSEFDCCADCNLFGLLINNTLWKCSC